MIGCLYSCPMCNHKCDLQNDDHETHICQNGSQLRCMIKCQSGQCPHFQCVKK